MAASDEAQTAQDGAVRERISATPTFRKVILKATSNETVSRFVRQHGMRLGAARFVAGETLDEAIQALRALNEQGFVCNTTILGEGVHDEATAYDVVAQYRMLLDRIAREGLKVNV